MMIWTKTTTFPMMKPTTSPEAAVQAAIVDYLVSEGYLVIRVNSGQTGHVSFVRWQVLGLSWQDRGVSDLLALSPDGKLFAIECKSPGGALRPEQRRFLDEASRRGAITIIATSLRDVQKG